MPAASAARQPPLQACPALAAAPAMCRRSAGPPRGRRGRMGRRSCSLAHALRTAYPRQASKRGRVAARPSRAWWEACCCLACSSRRGHHRTPRLHLSSRYRLSPRRLAAQWPGRPSPCRPCRRTWLRGKLSRCPLQRQGSTLRHRLGSTCRQCSTLCLRHSKSSRHSSTAHLSSTASLQCRRSSTRRAARLPGSTPRQLPITRLHPLLATPSQHPSRPRSGSSLRSRWQWAAGFRRRKAGCGRLQAPHPHTSQPQSRLTRHPRWPLRSRVRQLAASAVPHPPPTTPYTARRRRTPQPWRQPLGPQPQARRSRPSSSPQ